jgi:uncharacterized membrane protein YuzA (DUF378 family)
MGDRQASKPLSGLRARLWVPYCLAADLRIHLVAFVFALGTIHHELQFILEQQLMGPFTEYLERWSRVKPSLGWPSEIGVAIHLADILISVLILALPYRRELLCLLAPTFLLSNFVSLERIPAHNSLMAAALVIVLAFGLAEIVERLATRTARGGAASTDWYGWTLSGLAGLVALVYFFAAFQKLNRRWFSPEDSPVMTFVLPYVEPLGIPESAAVAVLGYPMLLGVLATEVSLPFLLFRRRTRLLGFLLGLLFHLPMLAQGVMDFPPLLLSLYPAFMSLEEARELVGRLLARPSPWRLASSLAIGLAGVWTIATSSHTVPLYAGSRGLEPLLMYAHSALLYATFFLFVHVTATIVSMLLARRRAATGLPQRVSVRLPA